jgi:hypothetical protein
MLMLLSLLLLLQVVQVKMMYRKFQTSDLTTGDEVLYGTLPGRFRAVKLPYKDSTIVAYAVLPDLTRYNNAGVDAAAAEIGPRLLFNASLWSPMWRFGGKLEVQMPRFHIATDQIQLKQVSACLNNKYCMHAAVWAAKDWGCCRAVCRVEFHGTPTRDSSVLRFGCCWLLLWGALRALNDT